MAQSKMTGEAPLRTVITYGTEGCYHVRYEQDPPDYKYPGRTRDEALALFFKAHAYEFGIERFIDEPEKLPPGKATHTPSSTDK